MFRAGISFCIVAVTITLVGCSGNTTNSPVTPSMNPNQLVLTENKETQEFSGGHNLWGFWQGITNKDTGLLEIIPLRGTAFHMNLSRLAIESDPVGINFSINSFNYDTRILDCDVSITHPLPDSNFRGFDVRGIFMGPGDVITSKTDNGIIYNGPDGCRVLNADGYTRWWNAVEFTSAGIFGYDDSRVVPSYLIPTTTLNPYKYFSDPLGPNDPVTPHINQSNRGTFSTDLTDGTITRNYQIQFQEFQGAPQLGFHYALDVSWAPPTGNSPDPKPIGEFPQDANCPEAYHICVDSSNSSLWYVDDQNKGGDLVLSVEVFDWQAPDNPDGISGEIESIWIESPTLFEDPIECDLAPQSGTSNCSGIFEVVIPGVHPAGLENQEILVSVFSREPDSYIPPSSDSDYPSNAKLAAYAIKTIPVSDSNNQVILLSPNGNELWSVGDDREIEWYAADEVNNVAILLSTDSGDSYSHPITLSTPNDGSYNWYSIPDEYISTNCRIKIIDADNFDAYDESDCDFSILAESPPAITVISPNGSETWGVGSEILVKWDAQPDIPYVRIELSKNAGETFENEIEASTSNDGVYEWTIPSWADGSQDIIKISNTESPMVYDQSDDVFTVNPEGVYYIDLITPNGGEEILIGNEYSISWEWSGDIPFVHIWMSTNGGTTFDYLLAADVPNTGSFDITEDTWALWPWILDPVNWPSTELNCRLRIQEAGYPPNHDISDSNFTIPMNLGILHTKINQSSDIDTDEDGIPNDCETFIGSDPESRDVDKDFFFDYDELFGYNFFQMPDYDPDDLLPRDGDGTLANNTSDVNNDGEHDGEAVDTDEDGIPNYLEYYGYTWDWISGTFSQWDGEDVEIEYYKTDPMQISTDQDPYSDYMETTKANMDVSVLAPGDSPMVAAAPNIEIVLEGYSITLVQDITNSEGGQETEGTEWEVSTQYENSTSHSHGFTAGFEVELGWEVGSSGVGKKGSVKFNASTTHNWGFESTNTWARSNGGSTTLTNSWDTATCYNPSEAARIKLYLKVYNTGTATASNIIPTFTLMIGGLAVGTFEQGNSQINILAPGDVYPAGEGVHWVIDSVDTGTGIDSIYLTLAELKALESGAPVKIVLNQMLADVMMLDGGIWTSAGSWSEYMSRIDAVCADVIVDSGQDITILSQVYADDSPSSPQTTLRDALLWLTDGYTNADDEPVIPFIDDDGSIVEMPLINWHIAFDEQTCNSLIVQKQQFDDEHQFDDPVPEYNVVDTVIGPSAEIGLRPPRLEVSEEFQGPDIHFATLNESAQAVHVCLTDYYDIDSVSFVDKSGGSHNLENFPAGSVFWSLDLLQEFGMKYSASGNDDEEHLEGLIITYLDDSDSESDVYVQTPLLNNELEIIYDLSDISPEIISTYWDGNHNTIEADVDSNGGYPIYSVTLEIFGQDSVHLVQQEGNTWFRDMDALGIYGDLYGPNGLGLLRVVNTIGNEITSTVFGCNPLINRRDYLHSGDDGWCEDTYEMRRKYNFDYGTTPYEYPGVPEAHILLEHADNSSWPTIIFNPDGTCDELKWLNLPEGTPVDAFDNLRLYEIEHTYDSLMGNTSTMYQVHAQTSGDQATGGSMFLIWTGHHYVKLRFSEIIEDDSYGMDAHRVYFEYVTFTATADENLFDYVMYDSIRDGLISAALMPNAPVEIVDASLWSIEDGGDWLLLNELVTTGQGKWTCDISDDHTFDQFPEKQLKVSVNVGDSVIYHCELTDFLVPFLVFNNETGDPTIDPMIKTDGDHRHWDFETARGFSATEDGDLMVHWKDCDGNPGEGDPYDPEVSHWRFHWPDQTSSGLMVISRNLHCSPISAAYTPFNETSLLDILGCSTSDTPNEFVLHEECGDHNDVRNCAEGSILYHKDPPYFTKIILRDLGQDGWQTWFDYVTYELPIE